MQETEIARNRGREANFSTIRHITIAWHQSCGRTDFIFLIDRIFPKNLNYRYHSIKKYLNSYMRGRKTFHKMSEMCADPGSFSKTERASRSRIRTRICANRSTSRDCCFEMAPLRNRNSSRRDSTVAISRFLDDNMNKWHTIDFIKRTISDQDLEQV